MQTQIKLVMLGGGGVGKSCLTIQFTANHFMEEYDPTIEDSYRKQVNIDDQTYLLDILDTGGREEYSALRDQYTRDGKAFLFVYSITSQNSLQYIQGYVEQVMRAKNTDRVCGVLCGNKSDLGEERQVIFEEGADLARKFELSFFETSAKNRVNVEEAFFQAVRLTCSNQDPSGAPRRKKKQPCILL